MKQMKQWFGIMLSVVLAVGALQVPAYATETGETAVEAEVEAERIESAAPAEDKEMDADFTEESAELVFDGVGEAANEEIKMEEETKDQSADELTSEQNGVFQDNAKYEEDDKQDVKETEAFVDIDSIFGAEANDDSQENVIAEENMYTEIFSAQPMRAEEKSYSETVIIPIYVKYGQTAARDMLRFVNEFRTGQDAWVWNQDNTQKVSISGLPELSYDYRLERIAMHRAAELALSYSHIRPNGSDVFSLMSPYDYEMAGENIAAGYESTEAVFNGWKEEDELYTGQGHRRNMLDRRFTHIGIGHVYFEGTHYWTQVFSDCSFDAYYEDEEIILPPEGSISVEEHASDFGTPNDQEEIEYIEIALERMETLLETDEDIVRLPIFAWADLPTVTASIKVQDAWPDKYYQLPFDDFYHDHFSG